MPSALVIGGTGRLGRHVVAAFRDDHDVTAFSRGETVAPDGAAHVEGDRTNDSALELAAAECDPDVVVDCAPADERDVRAATGIFADADYVAVGRAEGYADEVPARPGDTPFDGPSAAAPTSLRVPAVVGPGDPGPLAFWFDRVATHDRLVVPGDGQHLRHLAFAPDVGRAARIVAGAAGAYNVGAHTVPTLAELIGLAADALDADPDLVTAGPRELGVANVDPTAYPLYADAPRVLSTAELAGAGWTATPVADAIVAAATGFEGGAADGPTREAEERVLGVLDTL